MKYEKKQPFFLMDMYWEIKSHMTMEKQQAWMKIKNFY